MNYYEIVLLLRKDLTVENIDLLFKDIEKILTDNKATLHLREYWGLRNLAYKINKSSKAHYVFFKIKADDKAVKEVGKFARYNEDIIRNKVFISNDNKDNSRLFVSIKASDPKEKKQDTSLDAKIEAINITS